MEDKLQSSHADSPPRSFGHHEEDEDYCLIYSEVIYFILKQNLYRTFLRFVFFLYGRSVYMLLLSLSVFTNAATLVSRLTI